MGMPRYAARLQYEFVVAGIKRALRITGRNVADEVAFAHNRNSDARNSGGSSAVRSGWRIGTVSQISRCSSYSANHRRSSCTRPSTLLRCCRDGRDMPERCAPRLRPRWRSCCPRQSQSRKRGGGFGPQPAHPRANWLKGDIRRGRRPIAEGLATQYLDPGMSLGQIAWLRGYEGSTSFNHAFKRWTGRSPSADRDR
jgi:AraC-like DNA-binding protein